MGISFKGLTIGIVASIAVCLIVSCAELVVKYIQIGFLQLPPVVVGLFCFILLVTAWTKRTKSRFALTPQELLTVYCMMLLSSMISSRGCLEKILPLLVTLPYFANETNGWSKYFFPHIKKWMVPFDPSQTDPNTPQLVAKRFFEGLHNGETIPWHQWIGPLAWWALLALFIFGAFLCLASILRRQWVDNEKLTFPLAQLPLEMVGGDGRGDGFWKNPLTWLGFAIPCVVFTINGLHGWYPSLPMITLDIRLAQYFINPPWDSIGFFTMYVSFAAIGFFFLLPTEIIFSLWFFHLFAIVQTMVASSYGMEMLAMPLYGMKLFIGYQEIGAYFVLSAYLLYVSWPHLKQVMRATLGREKVDDSNELLPYRTAVFGLFFCVMGATMWFAAAGMNPWLALFELLIYVFVIAIIMARSTAEGGMLMTETTFRGVDVYRIFAPTHTLGAANMTMLGFMDAAWFRDLRGLVLTGFLDGLKIADGAKIRRRSFLPVFVVAILIAMIIGGIFQIYLPYSHGGINLYGYTYMANNMWAFQDYTPAMRGPVPSVGWQAPVFFVVGVVVTLFLAYMRYTFFWWPLHPLGYALCYSWTIMVFWFPCFVAWLIKVLVMRYGGMKMYLRARPFMLGLIMGEFSMAVVWALIAWAFKVPAPFFPWP
jgi:hypothetical protein